MLNSKTHLYFILFDYFLYLVKVDLLLNYFFVEISQSIHSFGSGSVLQYFFFTYFNKIKINFHYLVLLFHLSVYKESKLRCFPFLFTFHL
ncbi:hypothetical protein BY458DRAFT_529336 [Sporodiniella umbellata]|nr:hypothetical protein BY458DRAFT_529336 [Sporodiniella umbellata]